MTYKSSPQTFIFKYIFPVMMLSGGIFGFFFMKNSGNVSQSNFANAYGIALIWVSIFLVQLPFKLREVEVNEEGLKVKSGDGTQIIPFKKINAVSKFDLSSPWMITVKYFDSKMLDNRKIFYMPNAKYQRFMKEDEMTAYLSEKARSANPDFVEPNAIKNLFILFLAGLPFFIAMFYFMSKSVFYNF